MRGASLVVGIAVVAFLSAIAATTAALVTIELTRPSDRELQQAAADELGVPAVVLEVPGAQAVADDLTQRVAHRVIDEARPSVATGLTVGTLTGAATALIFAAALVRLSRRPGVETSAN